VELSRWVVRKSRIFLIRNELPPLRRRYIYFVRGIINRSSVYLVIRGKNNAQKIRGSLQLMHIGKQYNFINKLKRKRNRIRIIHIINP